MEIFLFLQAEESVVCRTIEGDDIASAVADWGGRGEAEGGNGERQQQPESVAERWGRSVHGLLIAHDLRRNKDSPVIGRDCIRHNPDAATLAKCH